MKLCKCGAIVERKCERCYPAKHDRTTKQRGYGYDHRIASEKYRAEHPICEACSMLNILDGQPVRPATSMHHIHKVSTHEHLRMDEGNWLALCERHHEELEDDIDTAMQVKRWSENNG